MNKTDIVQKQRQLEDALERLESLALEYEGLLGSARLPDDRFSSHAVDDLLQRLGDEAPVDDFEAGRRRDRRRVPRENQQRP